MGAYATEAASALSDVTAAGTAVMFTKITPGTYDPTTDSWTDAVDSSVAGYAIRVAGKPMVYAALSLIESQSPTLLFTPNNYGNEPALGATVTWNGQLYTVRDVNTLAPDGTAILSRVIVAS